MAAIDMSLDEIIASNGGGGGGGNYRGKGKGKGER